jgi:Nitrile hydratase, alpha chain
MVTRHKDFQKKWARVVAKAWSDPAFKKKLLNDPDATLAAEGITMHKGIRFEIHESTNKVVHLSMPSMPEGELSMETLEKIAAAGPCDCCHLQV